MKLISFTFTSEYNNQSEVQINPAFVVSLRPAKSNQTTISLASKAEITVERLNRGCLTAALRR